jgi:hypothetical protein
MDNIIFLREVADILEYKDKRSAEKWCKENGVEIFCDKETSRKYIIRIQFQYARLKKFISFLRREYKESWFEAFQAYMKENILHIVEFEEIKCKPSAKASTYQPVGEHEITFLASLSKQINEL